MPQFYKGETKTARVTMKNPTAREFGYAAILILGLPEVARSEVSVSISAGGEKQVSFPMMMPSAAGSFPAYLHVASGGQEIATLKSTEDVIVVVPVESTIYRANRYGMYVGGVLSWVLVVGLSLVNRNTVRINQVFSFMRRKKIALGVWGDWENRGTFSFELEAESGLTRDVPFPGDPNALKAIFLWDPPGTEYEIYIVDDRGNRSFTWRVGPND